MMARSSVARCVPHVTVMGWWPGEVLGMAVAAVKRPSASAVAAASLDRPNSTRTTPSGAQPVPPIDQPPRLGAATRSDQIGGKAIRRRRWGEAVAETGSLRHRPRRCEGKVYPVGNSIGIGVRAVVAGGPGRYRHSAGPHDTVPWAGWLTEALSPRPRRIWSHSRLVTYRRPWATAALGRAVGGSRRTENRHLGGAPGPAGDHRWCRRRCRGRRSRGRAGTGRTRWCMSPVPCCGRVPGQDDHARRGPAAGRCSGGSRSRVARRLWSPGQGWPGAWAGVWTSATVAVLEPPALAMV